MWSILTKTIISPAEVRLVCQMDEAMLSQMAEEREAMREQQRERDKANANRRSK